MTGSRVRGFLVGGLAAMVVLFGPGVGSAQVAGGEWEIYEASSGAVDAGGGGLAAEGGPASGTAAQTNNPGAGRAYAVRTDNRLITFHVTAPGTLLNNVAITGLQAGEDVIGIDVRPATGALYGLTSASRLYTINPATGSATLASTLSTGLSGTSFGIDFNPTVDRLRIVSDADQNLRVNVGTGAVTVDVPLAFAPASINFGVDPNVVAVAYTNSFAGATSTRLFGIDSNLRALVEHVNPNSGQLVNRGPFPSPTLANSLIGFDISPENQGFATWQSASSPVSSLVSFDLSQVLGGGSIDLASGRTIGGGVRVRAFALAGPVCTVSGGGSLVGTAGDDVICGSPGRDGILGMGGNDLIFGGGGDDAISGGDGNDLIFAGFGNDGVNGGDGNDALSGGFGDDIMNGADGNDSLFGGAGNDTLSGAAGNDSLFGGAGNDILNGGTGVNNLSGDIGTDVCVSANGGTVSGCP